MADVDLTSIVDHAAREQWQRMTRTTVTFDELNATDKLAVRSRVLPIVTDVLPLIRQQIAQDIEAQRVTCPRHGIPDCSPLLNGCSMPYHLAEQRDLAARTARGGDNHG